jgi:hypothetical protein
MPPGFSTVYITQVYPFVATAGGLLVSWQSSAPPGTYFQVYVAGTLAWFGTATQTVIPMPTTAVQIEVGTVGPGEQATDFSASLPVVPKNYVELQWEGGTFESPTLAGFYVYQSPVADAPVNYSSFVGNVPAYPGGIILDGFGLGLFGDGGFGEAGSYYNWLSQALYSGVWTWGVRAYDEAGNLSTTVEISETIQVPPPPPRYITDLHCLSYAYNNTNFEVTLNWLPTPGP